MTLSSLPLSFASSDTLLSSSSVKMQLKHDALLVLPMKPQIHSHKHHNTYNGSRHLPMTARVRRSAPSWTLLSKDNGSCTHHHNRHHHLPPLYEVTLYYERNRACTIYRTREDFSRLERPFHLDKSPGGGRADTHRLQRLLLEAIAKRPNECAVEYFLRRRMGDCGY